ncbi:HNH endonuclease [Streptococcus equi subsp. zooepidemicus]|uniref:HNH endonuclease n=1 Tax=Streptococcus equi TaxID=1336 RepID=UPI001E508E5D|nr:HNH endonuclease signature motif containing protein [Streptococcus equi]MCD3433182.1 HNH endonuclease [Streptococcus equi subsp. zooepidemicus]WOK56818.1 HNH endonuclease signature motif containing protein [Streptococcus equi subsp. zooepidemicus]HEL0000868.1 HNH endonuclease [Streptococcus equi subsp. zooepidemicus]HEL0067064.1 HNH endonuclease [Streptococcus equi subsp. zooepidemicus]HEL0075311.1 HNH endonuclease [Streptococcus equi subsp. zooepidemicus]
MIKIDTTSKESMYRTFYHKTEWRKLRQEAIKRDNNECVWCRERGRLTTTNLEVDHIKEVQYYPELALDIDNLRTLCKECHNKRHGRYQKKENRWDDETFEW